MSSALEAMMLICFGFSWPINLIKNIKAKTARSMSLKFIILIIMGYIAGITAKLINHSINYVLIIYLLNLAIVSVNVFVYFINRRNDKQDETQATAEPKQRKKTEIESRFSEMNKIAEKNAVVFFGSNYFASIPFDELGKCYSINENLYNRSVADKDIDELSDMAESCVFELEPRKVFINIGDFEAESETLNIDDFGAKYEWLLYTINSNTDADMYIVSVMSDNANAIKMNNVLHNLAKQYGCEYIDITPAKGATNETFKAFGILKTFMRTRQIDFYDAMNM